MKSPITTLYYGNPPPFERKPPKPSEGDRLYGEVKARREALAATLTPDQHALLDAYDTALDTQGPRGSGSGSPRASAWGCGWGRSALESKRKSPEGLLLIGQGDRAWADPSDPECSPPKLRSSGPA